MIILHVTSISNPKGNGVAHAVQKYLEYDGIASNTASYNLEKNITSKNAKSFNAEDFHSISDLPEPFNNPDLVIFNEIYKPSYISLSKECIKKKIKYIIIPHGSLNKKAQREKRIKKVLANKILFGKFIKNASAIQFLTTKEKEASIFNQKRVIISGNGVDSVANIKNTQKQRRLVFIGRYQTKVKGLDILIRIVDANQDWFRANKVKIELYGRDSVGGKHEIEKLVEQDSISDIISINDEIYGEEKRKLLCESYAYVQLSRREGQPMSIIEALAYGLPCIVSKGTNFADYMNHNNCGFGCFDEPEIIEAIKEVCSNDAKRKSLSDNAIKAAKRDFLLDVITKKKISQYEEIAKC